MRTVRSAPAAATSCVSTGAGPEETATAFVDGWYHTGDAGHVDEEGYVFLVDRIKDMIVSGGENVYSIEVENAISTHPGVAQVAVIGIPHPVLGEQVHAIVVLHPGAEVTEDDIRDHATGDDRRLQGAQDGRVPHRSPAAVGSAQAAEARAAPARTGTTPPRSTESLSAERASSTDGCSYQTCGPSSSVRVRCRMPWSYCVEVTMPERLNTWIISRLSLSVSASNWLTPIWRAQLVR